MRILFLSHSHFDGVLKVGSHHLSERIARMGHTVVHVSTPLALPVIAVRPGLLRTSRLRLAIFGPQPNESGVINHVPLSLLPASVRVSKMMSSSLERRFSASELDLIFVDQPLFFPLLDKIRGPKIIYRPTDVHIHGRSAAADGELMKRAHGLVATSEFVRQHNSSKNPLVPSIVLENGVEFDRFSQGATGSRSGFVYVGAVDYRFDWSAVCSIARGHPDEIVRIVGPIRSEAPADVPENVDIVGPVSYSLIPKILQQSRVGLLPFSNAGINEGRSPMKYYEYLAAGLQVIGSRTNELSKRSAPGVHLWDGERSVIDCSSAALHGESPNLRGVSFAAEFDWTARAEKLLEFCASLDEEDAKQ